MKTEDFTKLRGILGGVPTAMLIMKASNDLLKAREMALAEVEESGRVWFVCDQDSGNIDELEREARVHLVFQKDLCHYLSVNGIATVVSGRRSVANNSLRADVSQDAGNATKALIFVDPRKIESWDSDGCDTVTHMFRAAKAYVSGPVAEQCKQHGLLAA